MPAEAKPERSTRRAVLLEWAALTLALSVAAYFLATGGLLWRLDRSLYDQAMTLSGRAAPDDILIIAVDEESLAQVGRWPWRRAVHATLLEQLRQADPRAILLDFVFSERDPGDPSNDAALAEALRRSGKVALPVFVEARQSGILHEILPLPELARNATLGHVHLEIDPDGLVRSVFLREGFGVPRRDHIARALLRAASGASSGDATAAQAQDDGTGRWKREQPFNVPYAGPPGHFKRISYVDFLRGKIPLGSLKDKFILVGVTAAGLGDSYPTPTSGLSRSMPGVEITANILDALLRGRSIRISPDWLNGTVSALAIAGLLGAFLWLSPRASLWSAVALCLLSPVICMALFASASVWFSPVALMASAAFAYPFWSWRRLEAGDRFLDEQLSRLEAQPGVAAPGAAAAGPASIGFLQARIDAVRTATDRLEEEARRRKEMIAFLSHDVRSPQASILAVVEIERYSGRLAEDDPLLRDIEGLANKTIELAEGFVQMTRAESESLALEDCDLRSVVGECVQQVASQARVRNVALSSRFPEQPAEARIDRQLVARAVTNLLGNAIKFSTEGTSVSVTLEHHADRIACRVTDQGVGIAPEAMQRLFKPFSRVGDGKTKGIGLGLALVKAVAERHGGRVEVASEPAQGSTFSLWLPRAKSEDERRSAGG